MALARDRLTEKFAKESKVNDVWKNQLRTLFIFGYESDERLASLSANNYLSSKEYLANKMIDLLEKIGQVDFKLIIESYKKLERVNLRSLNIDIAILLSGNDRVIEAWVSLNKIKLSEPLDYDCQYSAIDYLAFTNKVDLIFKLSIENSWLHSDTHLLFAAALGDSKETLDLLIKKFNFDTSIKDSSNAGIAHYAALGDSERVLKALHMKEYGKIDFRCLDRHGAGLQHYAAVANAASALAFLVEIGLDMRAKSETGMDVQHLKASSHDVLLEYSEEKVTSAIKKVDKNGWGILHHAVGGGLDNLRNIYKIIRGNSKLESIREDETELEAMIVLGALNNRADVLSFFLEKYLGANYFTYHGSNLNQLSAQSGGVSAFLLCCTEIKVSAVVLCRFEMAKKSIELQKIAQLRGSLNSVLICQLLGLKLSDVLSPNKKINLLVNLSKVSFSKEEQAIYGKVWNTSSCMIKKMTAVMDYYLAHPFYKYCEEVTRIKQRISEHENKSLAELFICFNNRILNFILNNKIAITDPFVGAMCFARGKLLKNILIRSRRLDHDADESVSFRMSI